MRWSEVQQVLIERARGELRVAAWVEREREWVREGE
jgi:hypothetical protein